MAKQDIICDICSSVLGFREGDNIPEEPKQVKIGMVGADHTPEELEAYYGTQPESLQKTVDNLKTEIETLKSDLTGVKTDISDMQTELSVKPIVEPIE